MPRYRLDCRCGKATLVSTSQAGESIACECGLMLEIPALRQLKQLPVVSDEVDAQQRGGWGFRQGVLTAALLVATTLASIGGYFHATAPRPPEVIDRDALVAAGVEQLTAQAGWELWVSQYQPVFARGQLEVAVDYRQAAYEEQKAFNRLCRMGFYGAALVSALAGVVVAISASPRSP